MRIKSFATFIKNNIAAFIVGIILFCGLLANAIKANIIPNLTTETTVISVGSKGITVEYCVDYGYGESTETANVNIRSVSDLSEYDVGDTITIKVYDARVDIVKGADK